MTCPFALADCYMWINYPVMNNVLITGASSGLGFETARMLAGQGHRVVLAVRNRARGEAALAVIEGEHPHAELSLAVVDLADLDTVRALAETRPEIDILINNAGVGTVPLERTKEGVVLQFGANHLGHFLLTALLYPQLERARDPRVVTISSGFGRKGKLDLRNVDASRSYSSGGAYMQSKLANALFAAELDRRLRARNSHIKSVVAHPGIAQTPLQQKPTGAMGVLSRTVSALFGRSAQNGALPTVQAAMGPDVQSGDVFGPGSGKTAQPKRESRWPAFDDLETARALWDRSEALTGIRWLS